MRVLIIFFCSALFLSVDSRPKFNDLVVVTDTGTVEGWEGTSRDGRTYQGWTGIPYAEPPVGPLRFKAPKPKTPWEGVLKATDDVPVCMQAGRSAGSTGAVGSEDCLYLSVYRPKIMREKMPVIFHVPGGAFQNGGMGSAEMADYLMDEDVVVVMMQYRVNAFGFMTLGDSVMPGNFGIKDQVLALKWVKRNIAAFGGNPNSVTVIGESAGSASTHLLLKTPATDHLVHRAVSDSGSINKIWSLVNPEYIKQHTLLVAKKSGCSSKDSRELLKCLQGTNASVIIENMMSSQIEQSVLLFTPVIEPADAEDPIATFDISLRPTKKPWMTSTATGEWLLFLRGQKQFPADMRKYLLDYLSLLPIDLTETQKIGAAEVLEKFYFPSATPENFEECVAKLEADMSFLHPIMSNVELHEGPAWIYRYEYVDASAQKMLNRMNITEEVAPHASQSNNYLDKASMRPPSGMKIGTSLVETPQDYEVSKRIIKYIVNFAYYDDPTPGESPFKWKQYKDKEILRVTKYGDFYADEKVLEEMKGVYSLWDTIIGRRN